MRLVWARRFALVAMVGVFAGGTAAAQQVTFTKKAAVGDKMAFSQSSTVDTTVVMSAGGQQMQRAQQSVKQLRKGNLTVEAVDAAGRPTKVTYVFDNSTGGETSMPGMGRQPMPSSLSGKTITVTRTGEKDLNYSAEVDPQAAQELKEMFAQDHTLLPEKPIAVGDSWDVDPADLKNMMPPGEQVDVKGGGKLVGVEVVNGRQVATVEFTITMSGGTNAKIDSKLTGKGTVDVASSHPLELTLSGPLKAGGAQQTPNGPIDVSVDGRMDMAVSNKLTAAATVAGGGGGAVNPLGGEPVNPLGGGGGGPVNPLAPPMPPAISGTYANDKLTIKLTPGAAGSTGTIKMGEKEFQLTAKPAGDKKIEGKFQAGENSFDFTASLDGDTLTLVTGKSTYVLKKSGAANPLDP